MNRERLHILFIIGANNADPRTLDNIRQRLANRYGGYTLTVAEGGWCEDAGDLVSAADFAGELAVETAYRFELCLIPEMNADAHVRELATLIAEPCSAVNADWIHVETWTTEAHHFSVQELFAAN